MYRVDNAVIMAAGTASRFAPLSFEYHKALIEVRGEILIERQIRQLQEAGVPEIYVVTGYRAEQFSYLEEKFGVHLIHNPEFLTRNNNSSIYSARHILKNSYVCSADNYFTTNPFEAVVSDCYYAALYADGPTKEWCMESDSNGVIQDVTIGGEDAWYMLGHTFWDEAFSRKFIEILEAEYDFSETVGLLWENIFMNHLDELKMKIRKYAADEIFEFDTLDELRQFDISYQENCRSKILKDVAQTLDCLESEIVEVTAYKNETNEASGFTFSCRGEVYVYRYDDKLLRRL